MYSVHCETCSERTEADTYRAANEFFMEHAEDHHQVELVNDQHVARTEDVAAD